MGTIFLSAFCALALNVQATEVKQDTIHKYVIDKQAVENFNGTQLEGKTISKYIIAYKNVGKTVEKTHVIYTGSPMITASDNMTTEEGGKTISIKNISKMTFGNDVAIKYKGLVIIDGKEAKSLDFAINIEPESIASIDIHKPGSKVAESYGEKGKNGVIMVTTKKPKSENTITYFIDGQKVDKRTVENLDPAKIASMNVNKKDGNSAIEITLKK